MSWTRFQVHRWDLQPVPHSLTVGVPDYFQDLLLAMSSSGLKRTLSPFVHPLCRFLAFHLLRFGVLAGVLRSFFPKLLMRRLSLDAVSPQHVCDLVLGMVQALGR